MNEIINLGLSEGVYPVAPGQVTVLEKTRPFTERTFVETDYSKEGEFNESDRPALVG
jgi:hypothetical protein